jgi:predicted AAA+ superfamily ATPase
MYERFIERRAEQALSDTPVVLIVGPRRAGKTTLVRKMGEAGRTYITLDDQTVLEAAKSDPTGFIRGLDQAIIDEIQRAPDLLLAIKKSVDEDYRPGRFLLTGSANVLTLPRIADSLAGRMETIQMMPLARAEIDGQPPTFLERLFEGKLQSRKDAAIGDDLVRLVLLGGFPEAISRETERRRQDWARSYLNSILTPRSAGHRGGGKTHRAPKIRAAAGRAFRPAGQLFAVRGQHQRQPQNRTTLRRLARTGFPDRDGAALVHQCPEADRQDPETAFSRFGSAGQRAWHDIRQGKG